MPTFTSEFMINAGVTREQVLELLTALARNIDGCSAEGTQIKIVDKDNGRLSCTISRNHTREDIWKAIAERFGDLSSGPAFYHYSDLKRLMGTRRQIIQALIDLAFTTGRMDKAREWAKLLPYAVTPEKLAYTHYSVGDGDAFTVVDALEYARIEAARAEGKVIPLPTTPLTPNMQRVTELPPGFLPAREMPVPAAPGVANQGYHIDEIRVFDVVYPSAEPEEEDCVDCGDSYHPNDLRDSDRRCEECAEHYDEEHGPRPCDRCGIVVAANEVHSNPNTDDNNDYCMACHTHMSTHTTCSDCNAECLTTDMIEDSGDHYCKVCDDKYKATHCTRCTGEFDAEYIKLGMCEDCRTEEGVEAPTEVLSAEKFDLLLATKRAGVMSADTFDKLLGRPTSCPVHLTTLTVPVTLMTPAATPPPFELTEDERRVTTDADTPELDTCGVCGASIHTEGDCSCELLDVPGCRSCGVHLNASELDSSLCSSCREGSVYNEADFIAFINALNNSPINTANLAALRVTLGWSSQKLETVLGAAQVCERELRRRSEVYRVNPDTFGGVLARPIPPTTTAAEAVQQAVQEAVPEAVGA